MNEADKAAQALQLDFAHGIRDVPLSPAVLHQLIVLGIDHLADAVSALTLTTLTGDVTSSGNVTTISPGAVDIAMLSAAGTPSATTFLRGDNTWATVGDALVANPLSQFAATTSAQLAGVISDETGSGALVFADSPTLVAPDIGSATGTSLWLTGQLAWTTNGSVILRSTSDDYISSSGANVIDINLNDAPVATFAATTLTLATDYAIVFAGTGAADTRTNLGLSTLATTTPGTGVATALAVNVGSAGAPVLFDGAGGTPTSLVLTNATGLPIAGGGTGASTAAGALSNLGIALPSSIQGMTMWLDASILARTYQSEAAAYPTDGTAINKWISRHSNINSTTWPNYSATGTARPLYKTGIQNSKAALLFDGTNDSMSGAGLSTLIGSAGWTVFVACKPTALVSTGSGNSYDRPGLFGVTDGYMGLTISPSGASNVFNTYQYPQSGSVATVTSTASTVGTAVVICSSLEDGTLKQQVTEGTAVTASANDGYQDGNGTYIGSSNSNTRFFTGYIFEVIVYNRTLSSAEKQMVSTYLRNKWAI